MNTNFKVIGLTRLGIKPESTAQETDALYHSEAKLKVGLLYFVSIKKLKTYDQKFIELKDFDDTIQNENEADSIYVFINRYANSNFEFCIIASVMI